MSETEVKTITGSHITVHPRVWVRGHFHLPGSKLLMKGKRTESRIRSKGWAQKWVKARDGQQSGIRSQELVHKWDKVADMDTKKG